MSSVIEMRICGGCRESKPETEFAFKNKVTGTRATRCRACVRAYSAVHYEANKSVYIERAKRNNKRTIARKREIVASLRTQPCTDCGNCYPPVCMEFDHRQGRTITGKASPETIAMMKNDKNSVSRLEEELQKCDLVCRNCHAIRTASRKE